MAEERNAGKRRKPVEEMGNQTNDNSVSVFVFFFSFFFFFIYDFKGTIK